MCSAVSGFPGNRAGCAGCRRLFEHIGEASRDLQLTRVIEAPDVSTCTTAWQSSQHPSPAAPDRAGAGGAEFRALSHVPVAARVFVVSARKGRGQPASRRGAIHVIGGEQAIVGRWFTEFWGGDFNPAVIDELAAPDI